MSKLDGDILICVARDGVDRKAVEAVDETS